MGGVGNATGIWYGPGGGGGEPYTTPPVMYCGVMSRVGAAIETLGARTLCV